MCRLPRCGTNGRADRRRGGELRGASLGRRGSLDPPVRPRRFDGQADSDRGRKTVRGAAADRHPAGAIHRVGPELEQRQGGPQQRALPRRRRAAGFRQSSPGRQLVGAARAAQAAGEVRGPHRRCQARDRLRAQGGCHRLYDRRAVGSERAGGPAGKGRRPVFTAAMERRAVVRRAGGSVANFHLLPQLGLPARQGLRAAAGRAARSGDRVRLSGQAMVRRGCRPASGLVAGSSRDARNVRGRRAGMDALHASVRPPLRDAGQLWGGRPQPDHVDPPVRRR